MKKTKILLSLLLAFSLHTTCSAQNDNGNVNDSRKKYEFVKTKSVNKTYVVSIGNKLKVSNSFGKVEVHTWNRNEIKVEVNVEATANKEALAQKIIDGISIDEKQGGGDISFKTDIKSNTKGKSDKSSIEINYSIYMPASNELELSNEFGATVLPDFKGRVDLNSKFGSLTTGALTDVKNINVEFGSANLQSVNNGHITIKFSSATLGKLSGNATVKFEFCSSSTIAIDNSLTSLDLNASYSTLNLKPAAGLPAAYHISTSFGSFKNRTGITFSSDEDEDSDKGPRFDFTYDGKSGSGSIPVKVKTSFGNIILGEPTKDDLQDDGKQKSKRKTT